MPLAPIFRGRPTYTAADPIAALYRDWRYSDAEAPHWCREWGKPESALARSVGFPRVAISVPSSTAPTWVTTHEDIDHALADGPDLVHCAGACACRACRPNGSLGCGSHRNRICRGRPAASARFRKAGGISFPGFAVSAGDLADLLKKIMLVLRMGQT
jgi:hypothetical protein